MNLKGCRFKKISKFSYFKLKNCKDGLQGLKGKIRTYLKSEGYKSKVPKEAHELPDIQKV